MKAFFLFFLIFTSAWAALFTMPDGQSPALQCKLINVSAHDANKSRLIILVGVPRDALSFIKLGQGYEARYGVSIAVIDHDGFGVAERESQQQFHVKDYAETNLSQEIHFELFEFDLSPGTYEATVTITDAAGGRQTSFSEKKILQSFALADPGLALSDIIVTNQFETDSAGRPAIVPGFFQNVAAPGQELHSYLEIKSPMDEKPLYLRQIIRDRQNKTIVDQRRPWPRQAVLEKLLLPIWTDHLPYGAYEFEMQVEHGKHKKSVMQKFRVTWNGVPASGMHLQQALAQAGLIASAAERKALARVTADSSLGAQRGALVDFWRKRDDTPATPENEAMAAFYKRVEFANENFGGSREGWKTDLGRIFIQLGMPDAIEVDNYQPRLQRRQIWRYHKLQRHFLFVDQRGFGDFVLAQEQVR
ncbi:MAG: GWxTD domain-containing protein [bacterium]